MNVQQEPRQFAPTHDEPSRRQPQDGHVESTSTRVLLESNTTLTCDSCDKDIQHGTRHKCVTVRYGPSDVSDLHFCDDECLASVVESGESAAGAA
jgi:hypothetical protein